MEKERIQKILSSLGYCSRRKAEELIRQGRVKVNGQIIPLGFSCLESDDIEVDRKKINGKKEFVMWLLYAAGSAFFAGITSILAKCGIRNTDSTVNIRL